MTLLILAYFGGVLTIVSPCILPVLPFVFARADRPFAKSVLPMLVGMALTFAAVATLAAVAGSWAVDANVYGRAVAMALLAMFGLTLIFPVFADRLMAPLVGFGARLSNSASPAGSQDASILPSFLLGIATGFLWAPCAGPVLGLILTGAALNGANVGTSFLLLAYAAGAATSLALALAVGGRVFAAMKRSLGAGEWIRRGLGVAVLAAVIAIGFGLDTGFLTRISLSNTSSLEQSLIDRLKPSAKTDGNLAVEGGFPSLAGATDWLNSPPLTPQGLKGKVVVIDFWTYSCINCLRSIPYVRAWAEKYKDHGLVVIGVHTPEFAFERNVANVRAAVSDLKIGYPVAIDNDYKIWRAFDNEYWPAHYFIDAQGRIRHSHFGEGNTANPSASFSNFSPRRATRMFRPALSMSTPRARRRRQATAISRRRLISVTTGPIISSRRAASSRTKAMFTRRQRSPRSISGASPAIGPTKANTPNSISRTGASLSVFTPAICISFSVRRRTASRSVSA